jgi:hypothetical protein
MTKHNDMKQRIQSMDSRRLLRLIFGFSGCPGGRPAAVQGGGGAL